MIWKLKYNGNWVDMPTPSEYQIEATDIDDDSYRSVVNGSIVRELISRLWQKMSFTFAFKTEEEMKDMLDKISANTVVEIRCKSPVLRPGSEWSYDVIGGERVYYEGWVDLTGYINSYSVNAVNAGHGNLGYTCSFAFVEGYR